MSIKEITAIYRKFRGESDYQNMVDIINGSKDTDGIEWTTSVEEVANDYAHLHNCDPYTDLIFADWAVGSMATNLGSSAGSIS